MPVAARLVRLVRQALAFVPEASAGLVVAISGGADSVALLRALDSARDPHNPFPLVLAHLNHQLRGAESDADENFVAELYARLSKDGCPRLILCRTRRDMAAQAKAERANLEAVARRERYRWLVEIARTHGMKCIATGHTANDQAETVLHRLLRGTGLRGLRGIAARRELEPGLTLVRPLLAAIRAEILDFLRALSQPFRDDSSNADLRYTRNRIRHELLPLLAREYNPAVALLLASLAEQAQQMYAAAETEALALLQVAELPRAGAMLIFDSRRLQIAPRHLVREMFRLVWTREHWPTGRMNFEAWERLASVVFDDLTAVDFPGHLHARRLERVLQVGRLSRASERYNPS